MTGCQVRLIWRRLHRAAADAAEGGGGQAVAVAVRFLREFAPVVRLCGRTPGGKRREFLGVYDRCDDCPLIAGRCALPARQRAPGARGENAVVRSKRLLARRLGSKPRAPDWLVDRLRRRGGTGADRGRVAAVGRRQAVASAARQSQSACRGDAGGAEGMDASSGADSDDEAEKAAYQAAEAAEAAAEEMRRAHAEAVLDTASHVVHLDAEHPEQWGSRMHAYRSWMGTYEVERVDDSTLPLRVNGRYAYTHQSSREDALVVGRLLASGTAAALGRADRTPHLGRLGSPAGAHRRTVDDL